MKVAIPPNFIEKIIDCHGVAKSFRLFYFN